FLMPRLLNREWPSAKLISLIFWMATLAIIIMLLALHVGGWLQGIAMNNPDVPYTSAEQGVVTIMQILSPYLLSRSVSGALLTIGHVAFVINFIWILSGYKCKPASEPTLFVNTTPNKEA